MSMAKKACLFCGQITAVRTENGKSRFAGCHCTPGGFYLLEEDSYDAIRSLPFAEKHKIYPLLSGYIRESLDRGEEVSLSFSALDPIIRSPRIPATIAEKSRKLLQYLRRHADGPGEPVMMPQLSASFNLTYSPNQQELVFIIEKLREEKFLEREGSLFRLTEQGWREAAVEDVQDLPPCFVWVPEDADSRAEWETKVLPKLRQCGYAPRFADARGTDGEADGGLQRFAKCKLLIVDITGQKPHAYLAGGYAMGRNIPVIWTISSHSENKAAAGAEDIRPVNWTDGDQLAALLEQRLAH